MDLVIVLALLIGRLTRSPSPRPRPTGSEALALALLADGVCPRCLGTLSRGGACEVCGVRYIPA